jgi:lipopolysaccharide/colanic/teichoic acid biosynthesis glycosyltransferase
MLRGNFETPLSALIALMPYIFISVGCACLVFLMAGLDRTPWRYSSVADHLQVIVVTVLAILLSLVFTFALNRLEPVARSLPFVQAALIVSVLISARSAARFLYARRIHLNNGKIDANRKPHETVLVVGANTIAELFLLSVKELTSGRIEVAGILSEEPNMRGRTIQQKPVLGTVEELPDILQSLEVHGVAVNKIVVAAAANRLRRGALENLTEVEKTSNIVVEFLSERLGLEDVSQTPSTISRQDSGLVAGQRAVAPVTNLVDVDHANSVAISLRSGKRIVDLFGAVFFGLMLTPIAVLISVIVALDVGFPVIFWQQRPGLYGRPFKLYKFRTMRAPHDKQRRRIPDDQRSSVIGQIIRRIRVDELPQLYNVLIGDMSLIGPRPLLPCDQSPDYAARLLVRPGITGWAQVNGGRIISSSDKLNLDIWYVKNASLMLDLAIVLNTVKMILFGERINTEAIDKARSDLGPKMPLRTSMVPAE